MTETDIKLRKSANHPVNDSSTAGGSVTSTDITTATIGEWMPKLKGQTSGDLDVDTETQYQVAYVVNTNSSESLTNVRISIANYVNTHTAGTIGIAPTNASDNSTKFMRLWGKQQTTGLLVTEDVTLNGLTDVFSVNSYEQLYRAELRLVSSGALTNAAGAIDLERSGTGFGKIPQGYDVASREYAYAAPAAAGNVGTFSNRRTEPSGLTWVFPFTTDGTGDIGSGTLLSLPGTLAPSGGQVAVYCRQIAQPGMGTVDLKVAFRIYGEVA